MRTTQYVLYYKLSRVDPKEFIRHSSWLNNKEMLNDAKQFAKDMIDLGYQVELRKEIIKSTIIPL